MHDFYASRPAPLDQAQGLRRLFAGAQRCHVAVVGNAHVPFAGVLLERLTATFAALGRHTLIVDAASGSPSAHELSWVDLGACIEPLTPAVSYLAARGLPLRHVDTRGCADGLLDALADAAPQADVVLVHADAADLSRLFMRRPVRPLLLGADQPASVTEAYAGLKLLALRNGFMSFDLLLAVSPQSPRRERIAPQLADCADRFVGAALREWVAVDPAGDVGDAAEPALQRLAGGLLAPADDPAGSWPVVAPATAVRRPAATAPLFHSPSPVAASRQPAWT